MELPILECLRCSHKWIPRKPETPRICPKCKSPYWDRARKNPKAVRSGVTASKRT